MASIEALVKLLLIEARNLMITILFEASMWNELRTKLLRAPYSVDEEKDTCKYFLTGMKL